MSYLYLALCLAVIVLISIVFALFSKVHDLEKKQDKDRNEIGAHIRDSIRNLIERAVWDVDYRQMCTAKKLDALLKHLGVVYIANPESRFEKIKK